MIFPEGTFVRSPGLLPFRLGAFRAAVDTGRPIVPVAIRGTRHILPDGTWLFRRGPLTVTIGIPIEPRAQGWPEMVRLRDAARRRHHTRMRRVDIRESDNRIEVTDMQLTPTITFRGIEPSAALEAEIRTRIDKLETYYPSIMGCHVLVELLSAITRAGNRYHVRIDLTVPGEEIVVAHEASLHATAQDVDRPKRRNRTNPIPERKHASWRFTRRSTSQAPAAGLRTKTTGSVKTAARQPRGRVVQLFPIDEYGYIKAEDGHEVYFQKSGVLKDAFDRLTVGSTVSFSRSQARRARRQARSSSLHPRRARRSSPAAPAAPAVGR